MNDALTKMLRRKRLNKLLEDWENNLDDPDMVSEIIRRGKSARGKSAVEKLIEIAGNGKKSPEIQAKAKGLLGGIGEPVKKHLQDLIEDEYHGSHEILIWATNLLWGISETNKRQG